MRAFVAGLALAASVAAGGCSSLEAEYEMLRGSFGGEKIEASRIDERTYAVFARTHSAHVEEARKRNVELIMFKAAEMCLKAGRDDFVILDTDAKLSTASRNSGGRSHVERAVVTATTKVQLLRRAEPSPAGRQRIDARAINPTAASIGSTR